MGTDIHPRVQVRQGSKWVTVKDDGPKYNDGKYTWTILTDRNYRLFAVLANVRNGFGFAGVPTGSVVQPISKPRGLPDDVVDDGDFGDHDFSWVTLRELQEYPWNEAHRSRGVVSWHQYEKWDKQSCPANHSGGIMGIGIITVSGPEAENIIARGHHNPDKLYVEVTWQDTIETNCNAFIDKVIPWLATLGAPDDVRLMFGFDS